MKARKNLLNMFIVATALAASHVAAQDAAGEGTSSQTSNVTRFDAADRNHDGMWSRSEVPDSMGLLKTRFTTYDLDRDQRLSQAEVRSFERDAGVDDSDDSIRNFSRGTVPSAQPTTHYHNPTPIRSGGG